MANPGRQIKRVVPAPLRGGLRKVRDGSERARAAVTGTPPDRLRRKISPLWFDFKRTGADQVSFLVELGGLRPNEHVLDIGCGVGRVAMPLSRYLTSKGGYEGFDIAADAIEFCQQTITPKSPNFRFQHAAVSTSWGASTYPAAEYRFPYDDRSFDLVYAGSLYTHLLPEGAANYLAESARVLRPGGRAISTFLVYNNDTQRLVAGRSVGRLWPYEHGRYRTLDPVDQERSLAYDEGYMRSLHEKAGLTIVEPLRFDASYCVANGPRDREQALHLFYACSVITIRQ